MKRDYILSGIYMCIAGIIYLYIEKNYKWIFIIISIFISILYLIKIQKKEVQVINNIAKKNIKIAREIILLSEKDTCIARWDLYGKISMVIGRDIGENSVNINLSNLTYSSMIEKHHAVLNYCGNEWYIEDVSEKNGVSIEKSDKKKYKLAYGKPCKLESGDIIHIAMTKLKVI